MVVVLALLSAALYGCGDFCGGLASRRASLLSVLLVSHVIGLGMLVAVAAVLGGAVEPRDLLAGAAGGAMGGVGVAMLYRGLTVGSMSIVAPVSAVVAAALPVLVGLLTGDRPSLWALAGIVVALVSVVVISTGSPDPPATSAGSGAAGATGQALGFGVGAGACFAFFFLMLARASSGAQLWPLVAARTTTAVAFALVAVGFVALSRPALRVGDRSTWLLIAGGGILDASANIVFVIAVHRGLLSLVVVLSSLYPAATVLCAFGFLRERLRPMQLAGVAGALVGAALISAG